MNGELLQKRVEKIFKKKIIEDCIHQAMFDQCICGLKDLVKVLRTKSCYLKCISVNIYLYIKYIDVYFSFFQFIRSIFRHLFLYLSICWHVKNKKQGSLASVCIQVCLKNSLILIQDKK